MPRPLSIGLKILALLLLAGIAYGPLFSAGYRAGDLALYERAAEQVPSLDAISLDALVAIDPRGSVLANLEHAARASGSTWRAEVGAGFTSRLEAMALLLLAALGLGLFTRRLLLPWVGVEHARAAGWATAALGLTHPLCVALVAAPEARDEVLALALSAWCATAFLSGRQDRRYGRTVAAWVLCVLSALAGELAWCLPLLLAATELSSSHRYRPRRERTRTAANTLVLFSVAVAVAALSWLGRGEGSSRFSEGLVALVDGTAGVRAMLERVVSILLPASSQITGLVGIALASLVLLSCAQPALVAARSAPRLWSWLLGMWFAVLCAALVLGLDTRVSADLSTHGELVGLGVFIYAVGLGTACTALSGLRRSWLAWGAALVFAGLGHAGADAWNRAGALVSELRADLTAARELYGDDAPLMVLDPATEVGGVETLGSHVEALVHPLLDDRAGPARPQAVVALSSRAFLALTDEPEFEVSRREQLVVLVPLEELSKETSGLRDGGRRQAVRLGPGSAQGALDSWRGDARSPDLNLDTLSVASFVARADLRTDTAEPRRVHWRVTEPLIETAAVDCVWIETGDEPVLAADLGGCLAWRLGDRARRVWLEGGVTTVAQAQLLAGPQDLSEAIQPTTDGDDWLFPTMGTPLVQATRQRGRYVLRLLSMRDYSFVEMPVAILGMDHLRAEGAAAAVARMQRPVAWSLDYRVEDVPLARASGRRKGRAGTVEEAR